MRIEVSNSNCSGCSACANVCMHNAITMQTDSLGFKYPRIDESKCIGCGLCSKICQFSSEYDRYDNFDEPKVFAVRHKNEQELEKSQSGAAFFVMAEYILENGGIVYGAGFNEGFRVVHKRACSILECEEFRGSKYVQSDILNILDIVLRDLKNGLTVLFSGTPCQVAGLRSYVGKKFQKNLFTVDLVCHGVPSPAIWEDYLNYLEIVYNDKISTVKFRDKLLGWASHFETILFLKHGKVVNQTYRDLFYKHIMLRESCYNCPYTNFKRVSDITIGDFWGWNKISDRFDDNKGISLVLINSSKGMRLFQAIKSKVYFVESNTRDCLQPQLVEPAVRNIERSRFQHDYEKYGFRYVAKKYGNIGLYHKIKEYLKVIKNKIRKS